MPGNALAGKIIFKRKKNVLPLMMKLQILDRIREGESFASLARNFDLNESTIRTIKKSEDKIRNSASCNSLTAKVVRNPVIENMESELMKWMNDRNQQGIQLSFATIRDEAQRLYLHFDKGKGKRIFKASKGWFQRFKMRQSHLDMKFVGNILPKAEPGHANELLMDDDGSNATGPSKYEMESDDENETDPLAGFDQNDIPCTYHHPNEDQIPMDTKITALKLNSKTLEDGIQMAHELCDHFIKIDPSAERSNNFKNEIMHYMMEYESKLKRALEESKQQKITEFFKPIPVPGRTM